MARLARLVVPGLPHHVTQRGNRRQQTFFCDEDYAAYVELMMDEPYLLAAARYVELNPVRAGLALDAGDWRYSSAKAHLAGRDDALVRVAPLLAMAPDWRALLNSAIPEEELRDLREHVGTGYPLGSATFGDRLEGIVGRRLHPGRPGRPAKLRKRP